MYEITPADHAPTQSVAKWIAEYDVSSAPQDARDKLNLVLLDTLGVMIASTRYDVGVKMLRGLGALGAPGQVLVPGFAKPVDVASGALAYGTLGHGIELDEVHLPSRQHVGAGVGGAVLALGQHLDCTMAQLREALFVGYEVAGHMGVATDNNRLLDRNFHLSGVITVFGSTAAAARLLGLSPEQIYQALGLAASQAAGTLAWHTETHHMSKSIQCGGAARNGVTAAILAQQGYLGPAAVLAGPCNVFRAFRGADPVPANWYERLGSEFEVLNASMKLYAAGRPMHAALDALLDIMKSEALTADDIESMEVRMPPGAARIVDGNYTNSIDCRTVMATAAIDGQFGIDQADDEHMGRPDVQALKERIRLVHDTALDQYFPKNFPASLNLRCRDGREAKETVVAATGDRERPMTVEAIRSKFASLTEPVLGKAKVEKVADLIMSKQGVTVRELARAFAG